MGIKYGRHLSIIRTFTSRFRLRDVGGARSFYMAMAAARLGLRSGDIKPTIHGTFFCCDYLLFVWVESHYG